MQAIVIWQNCIAYNPAFCSSTNNSELIKYMHLWINILKLHNIRLNHPVSKNVALYSFP